MRRVVVLALVLTVGSAVLGATVLRNPIAEAASPFTNVIVTNTATNPVPVSVTGTVSTQSAIPPRAFSKTVDDSTVVARGAADATFAISSLTVVNNFDTVKSFLVVAKSGTDTNCGGFPSGAGFGPEPEVPPHDTLTITFPQPFVIQAPNAGDQGCLAIGDTDRLEVTIVGYVF